MVIVVCVEMSCCLEEAPRGLFEASRGLFEVERGGAKVFLRCFKGWFSVS